MTRRRRPATESPSVEALPANWRKQAKTLRRYGAEASALALEACAVELESALRHRYETTLTLTDAAKESGYSTDHLGRLVREGKIPNAGRPGAPRIARTDLPRKRIAEVPDPPPLKNPPPRKASNVQIVEAIIAKGLE